MAPQFQYPDTDSLKGLRIAVQGLGKVGRLLVGHLYEEGATLIVTDIFEENARNMEAAATPQS
ncbi:hypothetical protein EJA10_12155 [Mesobacillus subterraneus]|uniref:Uncharacterized protein n=1 Tax=Mesobacillus subterraneus TaxID=285983 RepID=A0A427TQF2_9BACI|nr:hypothetical protein [Mesobacillus subterraneus]RSD26629.1 hypothetical protein EJA10_12155 [Mesobacillus subterraneus]